MRIEKHNEGVEKGNSVKPSDIKRWLTGTDTDVVES